MAVAPVVRSRRAVLRRLGGVQRADQVNPSPRPPIMGIQGRHFSQKFTEISGILPYIFFLKISKSLITYLTLKIIKGRGPRLRFWCFPSFGSAPRLRSPEAAESPGRCVRIWVHTGPKFASIIKNGSMGETTKSYTGDQSCTKMCSHIQSTRHLPVGVMRASQTGWATVRPGELISEVVQKSGFSGF